MNIELLQYFEEKDFYEKTSNLLYYIDKIHFFAEN